MVQLTADALSQDVDLWHAEQVLDRLTADFQVIRGLGLPGQLLVRSFATAALARAALADNPFVAAFEIDSAVLAERTPDDPLFAGQWSLHNTGQGGAATDADIDGPEAWNLSTGTGDVVVAVVDTGVDYTHPDLAANIWTNPGEVAGNGIDDDGNGFVDDIHGWDFHNNRANPLDDNGHGTHVAGTIAAVGDNGQGLSGVAWSASIMPLKFLDENNQGNTSDAVRAINYATLLRQQQGVNVRAINASWGSSEYSTSLRDAVAAAGQADILVVAASGNGDALGRGMDIDQTGFYPAGYDLDNLVAVAASDPSDRLARFSNYGTASVDLAAPGVGITSTERSGAYASRNGTSMAAPHVTGAAVLVWSRVPHATALEVRQALLQGVDVKPELQGKLVTGGRLNAYRALTTDTVPPRATLTSAPDIVGPGFTHQTIVVTYTDNEAIDVATLDSLDLVVTRLNRPGDPLPVSLVAVNLPNNGAVRTATYRVLAPAGTWGTLDNGTYEISLRPQQVQDTRHNSARAVVLGAFQCHVLTDGIFHVDTYADSVDIDPGDRVVQDAVGHSPLRAAVQEANSLPGNMTIILDAGTYRLTIPDRDEDIAATGDLDILGNVTILGVDPSLTLIDAAGLDRVFDVHPGAVLNLSKLTVAGGSVNDSGGGIRNRGAVTLDRATVTRSLAGGELAPAAAEGRVRVSAESQRFVDLATDAAGNYVVVWDNRGTQDTFWGQRYRPNGIPAGSPFSIGDPVTLPADITWRPLGVAMNGSGSFVIAWTGADGDGTGIFAQRYGADGAPSGDRIPVNSLTAGAQIAPAVAVDPDGNFVVAWEDGSGQDGDGRGVYAQRYRAVGTRMGGQSLVNATSTGDQQAPAVAMDGQGNFLVAWQSRGQDGSGDGVFGRRGSLDSLVLGAEFRVPTTTTGDQQWPAAAMTADGRSIVAWQGPGQDGGLDVFGQRYDASGAAAGSEFVINATTVAAQTKPAVTIATDGAFAVAWNSDGQDGDGLGVYAQVFDPDGAVRWGEFAAHSLRAGDQQSPRLGVLPEGGLALAWQTASVTGGQAAVVRRFAPEYHPQDGGGIWSSGSLVLTDSTLAGNRSGGNGGGLQNSGIATITSSTVVGNTADGQDVGSLDPAGNESRVNTIVSGVQQRAAVAADAAGNYVVVWETDQNGPFEIHGQLFQADGTPRGNPFRVSDPASLPQTRPAIAMDTAGGFVVVWQGEGADGDGSGIRGRCFNADGSSRTEQFLANASALGSQTDPSVAVDAGGEFVIAWVDSASVSHVDLRRFDALARPLGGDFPISNSAYAAASPAIAMTPDGRFVVAWQSDGLDGDGVGVYLQRFDADAAANGGAILANGTIVGNQREPALAIAATGDLVVAWQDDTLDGSGQGIVARRFSWGGTSQGDQIPVNAYTAGDQTLPAIALDASGGFTIGWQSAGQDSAGAGVYAQRFLSDGAKVAAEFRVNTTTAADQALSGANALAAGENCLIAVGSGNGPGDSQGIFAQRYALGRPPTGSGGGIYNNSTLTLTNATLSGNVAALQGGGLSHAPSAAANTTNCTISANTARGEVALSDLQSSQTEETLPNGWNDTGGAYNKAGLFPSVAMMPTGDYLVSWTYIVPWYGTFVATQWFSAAGVPLTAMILPSSPDFSEGGHVACDKTGNFIVQWSNGSARRYYADGTPASGAFLIAGGPNGVVGMSPLGNFASVWNAGGSSGYGQGVYARFYDASGIPQGDSFEVAPHPPGYGTELYPGIASAPNGDFLLTWTEGDARDWGAPAMLGRRFNALGQPLGDKFFIGFSDLRGLQDGFSTNLDHQSRPAAFDKDGNFVAVWDNDSSIPGSAGIYARRFNAAGSPLSDPIQVNTWMAGRHFHPSVAMQPNGDFVVIWTVEDEDGSGTGVYGRRLNRLGVPMGGEFRVNVGAQGDQFCPDVAVDSQGNFLVTFWGRDPAGAHNWLAYVRHFSAVVQDGGGVYVADSAIVDVLNTLVAGNTGPHLSPDVTGTFQSRGHNLIGNLGNAAGFNTGTGGTDLVSGNAADFLGPLADNGGPTWTHALLADSPASDAGANTGAPATDQRGMPRPQDADADGQATVDIGAFEIYHGEIRGLVFQDLDGDGVRDPGEPGLVGRTVFVDLNQNGVLDPGEESAITQADDPLTSGIDEAGTYVFARVPPGTYTIAQVLQDGWAATAPISGVYSVVLTPGLTVAGRNFGRWPARGQIRGLVFEDLDQDGAKDLDESALPDWTVFLDLNENGLLDVDDLVDTTDSDGRYAFTGLAPFRSYDVVEIPQEHWEQTWPGEISSWRWTIELGAGQIVGDADFANRSLGSGGQSLDGVLRGCVFLDRNGDGIQAADEPGLVGRTVYLDYNNSGLRDPDEPTALTAAANPVTGEPDGTYKFRNLAGATYSLRLAPSLGSIQTWPVGNRFEPVAFSTGLGPQAIATGDLDGHGGPDLAVANGITNDVSILLHAGGNSYSPAVSVPVGYGAAAVLAADFDGDNDEDLAVANLYSGTVSLLKNRGDGTFDALTVASGLNAPRALAAIDFNRDGRLDLAVACELADSIVLLRNEGADAFAAAGSLVVGDSPSAIVAVQLDDDNGDGRHDGDDWADLVVANFDANSLSVLHGQAGGSFAAAVSYPAGLGPFSVASADLDRDGDADVAVADVLGNSVALLRNRGDGTFLAATSLAAGTGPSAVALADLDADGDPDVLVANGTSKDLAALRNRGGWSFEPAESFGVANFPASLPLSLATADINGDGRLDVAVANGAANSVSVLVNTPLPGANRVTITGTQTVSNLDFGVRFDNHPPNLDAVPDPAPVSDNAGPQTVALSGITAGPGETQTLQVSATSSNAALVPAVPIAYSSPDSQAMLTWQPAADQVGTSLITVTVRDAGPDGTLGSSDDATFDRSFTVTVLPLFTPAHFSATRTGFVADLNHDVVASVLNLYDQGGVLGPADVTVVGAAVGGVRGSLVVDPGLRQVTFIKTGGVLEPDTYTVTLVSGANAFRDPAGNLLDGNGDGTAGDAFTTTFTVPAPPAGSVTVSLPDFARGFGQPVNLPANSLAAGIPLNLSTGWGVSRIEFALLYDPQLLDLQAFSLSPALQSRGGQAQFTVVSPGTAALQITAPASFAVESGAFLAGSFTAAVPATAAYGAKHVLDITDLHVLADGAVPAELPSLDDDALHVAAFFGDANGSRSYNSPDVTLLQRLIGQSNSGLSAYQLADPRLLADITRNNLLQANDTASLQRVIGQLAVANVPALPTGLTPPGSSGADPLIYVPQDLVASPGDAVTVPIQLLVTEPAGITLSGFDLVLEFDPGTLTVGDVQPGELLAGLGFDGLWTSPAPGILLYTASSAAGTGLLVQGLGGDLVHVAFAIAADAPAGPTPINLRASFQTTVTAAFDRDLHELVLSPAPSNAADDSVDGRLTVRLAPSDPPPAQNPGQPLDTNDDGRINAADVLAVINYLNRGLPADASRLYVEPGMPIVHGDVNGDRRIAAQDVLVLVNHLNGVVAKSGEGEAREAVFAELRDEVEEDDEVWELLAKDPFRTWESPRAGELWGVR